MGNALKEVQMCLSVTKCLPKSEHNCFLGGGLPIAKQITVKQWGNNLRRSMDLGVCSSRGAGESQKVKFYCSCQKCTVIVAQN